MNRTIALFPLALGAFAASVASAQMTVRRTAKAIVVSSSGRPGYRLKLDLTQGGVATQFRIPADGPDVTSDQAGWSGLFGLYVQGGTDGPPPGADAYGERTLVKGDGVLDSARVAVRTPGRIVVDLAGHASGWGTYGRSGERFIDYRNRLTFEADRIVSNGEVTWVCGHDTVPNVIAPVGLFAPNLVQWPIRLIGPDGASHEIPLALDDEAPFPRGLTYPVTAEIWLRGGRCLLIRSLRVPHDWVRHPWLDYERPWLTHWRQSFAFTNNPADRGPVGKPIRYSYEIEIPDRPPSDPPPEVHIVSPVRGSDFFKDERLDQYSALRFKVGDTIRFAAVAKDRKDGWLADPAFRWSINWGERGPVQCAARGTGSQMDFTVPPADVGWYWVEVSAKDSSGVTGEDYITFKVER